MTPDQTTAYIAIAVMAVVTAATRFAGPILMRGITFSKRVEKFLDALSYSVLAAVVANYLASGGPREWTAVLVGGVVMVIARSAVWAMVAAMATAALWSAALGL